MQPLISIIVPVYNVEKYINRCVDSIVKQTYENIEIILVNDGSSDRSGCLCDEWVKRDNRIKVLHKENSGPSETRNMGVEIAAGDYISFIDSDDYVSNDYISSLYHSIIESKADIACCNYTSVHTTDVEDVFYKGKTGFRIISGKSACSEMYEPEKSVYYCVLWGKLFKPEIVKSFPLPVGKVHEDSATTFKYLYSAEKVSVSDEVLYAYYQNEKSIMHVRSENRRPDSLWAKMQQVYFFEEKHEKELLSKALDQIVDFYVSRAIIDQKRLPKEIFSFLKKYWMRGITRDRKIRFAIYFISPGLYDFYKSDTKLKYIKSILFSVLTKLKVFKK